MQLLATIQHPSPQNVSFGFLLTHRKETPNQNPWKKNFRIILPFINGSMSNPQWYTTGHVIRSFSFTMARQNFPSTVHTHQNYPLVLPNTSQRKLSQWFPIQSIHWCVNSRDVSELPFWPPSYRSEPRWSDFLAASFCFDFFRINFPRPDLRTHRKGGGRVKTFDWSPAEKMTLHTRHGAASMSSPSVGRREQRPCRPCMVCIVLR